MTPETVSVAIAEAKRFLKRAAIIRFSELEHGGRYISRSKETGALRRASMELTRALAEMRKP
jgi:hypothetical protein